MNHIMKACIRCNPSGKKEAHKSFLFFLYSLKVNLSWGGKRQNSGKATNQILTMVSSLQKKNMKQLFAVWPVYNYTEQQESREISQCSETKAWPMSMSTNICILNHLRQLQNLNFLPAFLKIISHVIFAIILLTK